MDCLRCCPYRLRNFLSRPSSHSYKIKFLFNWKMKKCDSCRQASYLFKHLPAEKVYVNFCDDFAIVTNFIIFSYDTLHDQQSHLLRTAQNHPHRTLKHNPADLRISPLCFIGPEQIRQQMQMFHPGEQPRMAALISPIGAVL